MLEPVSGSEFLNLENQEKEIKRDYAYPVKWSNLKNVNDLIFVLACLGMAFPGNHPQIKDLKQFLDLDNAFPTNLAQQTDIEINKI